MGAPLLDRPLVEQGCNFAAGGHLSMLNGRTLQLWAVFFSRAVMVFFD